MADKLKRGTKHFYNGQECWVEIHRSHNEVLIYFDEARVNVKDSKIVSPSDLKPANKGRTPIASTPKQQAKPEKAKLDGLNAFFDKVGLIVPFNCENCHKPLYAFNKKAKRSVSAHILPKAHFESVAMNTDNILFMGADYIGCPCNCHDRWDMNSDIRKSMPVYKLALERFEKMKPKLTDKELVSAYTYLGITWQ